MKKYLKLSMVLPIVFISGCNSAGSSSNSEVPQNQKQAIVGILDYDRFDNDVKYGSSIQTQSSNASIQQDDVFTFDNTACTPIMEQTKKSPLNALLKKMAVSKAIDFLKVGSVLKYGKVADQEFNYLTEDDHMRMTPAGKCIMSLESQIAYQINYMESKIHTLEDNVVVLQNSFYEQNYKNAVNRAVDRGLDLQTAIIYIAGSDKRRGLLNQFFDFSGLRENHSFDETADDIWSRVTLSTLTIATFDFFNVVSNISGSQMPVNCTHDCYREVESDSTTSLNLAYSALKDALVADLDNMQMSNQNASKTGAELKTNYSELLDNYNNTVVTVFQRSLYALQAAYFMEWSINKINFTAYDANRLPQIFIPSLSHISSTYYKYESPTVGDGYELNVDAYNSAQIQLTKLYMARVNQLFNTTLEYIATDRPEIQKNSFIKDSSYYVRVPNGKNSYRLITTNPETIDKMNDAFNKHIGSKLDTSVLDYMPGDGYKKDAVFYQFGGLRSLSSSMENMENYALSGSVPQTIEEYALMSPRVYADNNNEEVNKSEYIYGKLAYVYHINNSKSIPEVETTVKLKSNIEACNFAGKAGSPTGDLQFALNPNSIGGASNFEYLNCNSWVNPYPNTLIGSSSPLIKDNGTTYTSPASYSYYKGSGVIEYRVGSSSVVYYSDNIASITPIYATNNRSFISDRVNINSYKSSPPSVQFNQEQSFSLANSKIIGYGYSAYDSRPSYVGDRNGQEEFLFSHMKVDGVDIPVVMSLATNPSGLQIINNRVQGNLYCGVSPNVAFNINGRDYPLCQAKRTNWTRTDWTHAARGNFTENWQQNVLEVFGGDKNIQMHSADNNMTTVAPSSQWKVSLYNTNTTPVNLKTFTYEVDMCNKGKYVENNSCSYIEGTTPGPAILKSSSYKYGACGTTSYDYIPGWDGCEWGKARVSTSDSELFDYIN